MSVLKAVAREQITVSNAAKTLTTTTVETKQSGTDRQRVVYADIDVQDDDVYVTFDGSTTPAADAGEIWYQGDKKRAWGIPNLENLQFIRVTGDAVLEVTYWGV